jgi:hypothetical protein
VVIWAIWHRGLFSSPIRGGVWPRQHGLSVSGAYRELHRVASYRKRATRNHPTDLDVLSSQRCAHCVLVSPMTPLWAVVTLTSYELMGFAPDHSIRPTTSRTNESAIFFALSLFALLVILALQHYVSHDGFVPAAVGFACLL